MRSAVNRSAVNRHLTCSLVSFDVQLFHQPSILGKVVADELRELISGTANGFLSRVQETFPNRRIGQRFVYLYIETRGDGRGGSARCEYAQPLIKDQPFDSGLLKSRHVGQAR